MTRVLMSVLAAVTAALPVSAAAAPEQIATYQDWYVYVNDIGDDTICYAVSSPKDKSPSNVQHGDVYMMVATWASGAASEQPSFMAGYPLRDTPDPEIRIGSDRWDLFASGNEGFVEAPAEEDRLVAAMRRGANMRLSATSERGTATEYRFSLLGVTSALERAASACR